MFQKKKKRLAETSISRLEKLVETSPKRLKTKTSPEIQKQSECHAVQICICNKILRYAVYLPLNHPVLLCVGVSNKMAKRLWIY